MRLALISLVLLCTFSWQLVSGQSSSPSSDPPSPRALLALAVSATGADGPISPSGQCAADGATTLYAPGETTPAPSHLIISGAGTTQMTVQANSGTRSMVFSGPSGTETAANGSSQPLDPRTALLSQFLYLPMIELASIAADSDALLTLSSPTPINGHSTYALTVSGHWTDLSLSDVPPATVTFYIDSTTYIVVARQDTLFDPKDSRTHYDRLLSYDDYRSSGTFTVPFKVTQTIAGQVLSSTQWTSLTAAL